MSYDAQSGQQRLARDFATGYVLGTGAAIQINCGFKPLHVKLLNTEGLACLEWVAKMDDASGLKTVTDGTISQITTGGITPKFNGFSIGTDSDVNVSGEDLFWIADK